MPILQIVENQNLNIVAVEKASAARMQPPSERFSEPALPIAPPTPAIYARFYFESGVTSLGKMNYNKAAIEFTEAMSPGQKFCSCVPRSRERL
jgi:hypothetical protein